MRSCGFLRTVLLKNTHLTTEIFKKIRIIHDTTQILHVVQFFKLHCICDQCNEIFNENHTHIS